MKRVFCLFFSIFLLFNLMACEKQIEFSQKMTIVILNSSQEVKSTENQNTINEVMLLISRINKLEPIREESNDFLIMVQVDIDGQSFKYFIGENSFCDSDSKQYKIEEGKIIDEIMSVYNGID